MKEQIMVQLSTCPQCGFICRHGNDEDNQVHCVKCNHTFLRKEGEMKVTIPEYRKMKEEAKELHRIGGWVSFK